MLLSVKFSKQEILEAHIIPCIIKSSKTLLIKSDIERQNFFNRLNMLSSGVVVNKDGKIEQSK